MAREDDHLCALVLDSLGAAVPAPPSMTFPGIEVVAYVRDGGTLRYVSQNTHAVTLTGADGHYWLAVHADTATAVSGWTRQPGTHFLWRPSATFPGNPLAGVTFVDVTVAGGVITASALIPQVLGPPMSQFPASAVVITGGTATLDNFTVRGTSTFMGTVTVDSPTLVVDATQHGVGLGVLPNSTWALRASNAEIVGGFAVDGNTLSVDPVTNSVGLGTAPLASWSLRAQSADILGLFRVDNPTLIVDPVAHGVGCGVAPSAPWALRAQNAEVIGGFLADGTTLHVDPVLNAVGFGVAPVAGRSFTAVNASIAALITGPSSNLPSFTSQMVWYAKASGNGLTVAPVDNDTGPGAALLFWNTLGANVGGIVTSATGTTYVTTSDGRLKDAIQALPDALATLLRLRPVQFRWKANGSLGHGFLAEEVAAVVPDAVTGTPDAVDDQGQVVPMGMDASKVIPYLVGAVKDLAAQVETLTARLAALEA